MTHDASSKARVAATTAGAPNLQDETSAAAELPSLTDVSLEKDFTPFMQAKVPEMLRRQALKTLFKDAHFNTMDGLDTYIDDYTQFEPISAEDLEKLSAWQSIKNPLQQVVTPGGYAVDVKSEEGKAVLAAREALERGTPDTEPAAVLATDSEGKVGVPTLTSSESQSSSASDTFSNAAPDGVHVRHGKRVGDFKIDIQPLNESIPSMAIDANSQKAITAFDPR